MATGTTRGPKPPRWRSQAVFWTAIASRLKHNDAVAWYDVMNEPSASIEEHPIWCAAALGGFCYVQFLTKEPAGRTSVEIAPRVDDNHARRDPRTAPVTRTTPSPSPGCRTRTAGSDRQTSRIWRISSRSMCIRASVRRRWRGPFVRSRSRESARPAAHPRRDRSDRRRRRRRLHLPDGAVDGRLARPLLREHTGRDPRQSRPRRSQTTGTSASTGRSCASARRSIARRRRGHAALAEPSATPSHVGGGGRRDRECPSRSRA